MASPLNIPLPFESNPVFDTNSGAGTHTIPGSQFGYLGSIYCYVIQVAGYYEFQLSLLLSVHPSAAPSTLMAAEVGIGHVNPDGSSPHANSNLNFGATYFYPTATPAAPPSAGGQTVTLNATYSDYCGVGDFIVPFMYDLNPTGGSPSTYWVTETDKQSFFTGALIGP